MRAVISSFLVCYVPWLEGLTVDTYALSLASEYSIAGFAASLVCNKIIRRSATAKVRAVEC